MAKGLHPFKFALSNVMNEHISTLSTTGIETSSSSFTIILSKPRPPDCSSWDIQILPVSWDSWSGRPETRDLAFNISKLEASLLSKLDRRSEIIWGRWIRCQERKNHIEWWELWNISCTFWWVPSLDRIHLECGHLSNINHDNLVKLSISKNPPWLPGPLPNQDAPRNHHNPRPM